MPNLLKGCTWDDKKCIDSKNISQDELMSLDFKQSGIFQVFSGICLLFIAIAQFMLSTLDPLDSNLIINEQCINLSATYNLPKVTNAIQKSYLLHIIKERVFTGQITPNTVTKTDSFIGTDINVRLKNLNAAF
jgi:hypothetical protein